MSEGVFVIYAQGNPCAIEMLFNHNPKASKKQSPLEETEKTFQEGGIQVSHNTANGGSGCVVGATNGSGGDLGGVPLPPACNTGVGFTSDSGSASLMAGVGWLQGTLLEDLSKAGDEKFKDFMTFWQLLAGDTWECQMGRGIFGYHNTYRSALGVIIGFTSGRADVFIQIKQSTLDSLEPEDVRYLIKTLKHEYGMKFTRFDCWFDVVNSGVTKLDYLEAQKSGNIRTKAHDVYTYSGMRDDSGFTMSVGSRQSKRYVRIYDKGVESGLRPGEVSRWRYETEFKAEEADTQIELFIVSDCSAWIEVAISLTRSVIDFVDRSADSNISRCPLLEFWKRIVDGCIPIRLPVPVPVRTINGVIEHVGRVAGSSIKFLIKYFGRANFKHIFEEIIDKDLNLWQKNLLEQRELCEVRDSTLSYLLCNPPSALRL